jgi:NADH-quinone oxidoreductase E subunit
MDKTPLRGGNPGWAGEVGEFAHLKEDDVRGSSYFGNRPIEGIDAGGINAYPYQLEDHIGLVGKNPSPDARRPTPVSLFAGPYRERLQKIIKRYPDKQGALLPALNLAHEVHGFLTPEDMDEVARELELTPAYVRGVATFYTMYNRRPVGRYFIQVCTNVACNLCGADEVLEAFCEAIDSEPGQVSADRLFTVMEAECLGACGFPTAVQINERYFENVEPEDVPRIVDGLRARARARTRDFAGVPELIMQSVEMASDGHGHGHHHDDTRKEVP